MNKNTAIDVFLLVAVIVVTGILAWRSYTPKPPVTFAQKAAGSIFIAVEENGEAWYVFPRDAKRYVLGNPEQAFLVMSSLAVPALEEDQRGYIVRTEGGIVYVHPKTGERFFISRPADVLEVIQQAGRGITNKDIQQIPIGVVPQGEGESPAQ